MKTLILFLFIFVSFTACQKGENEIDPQNGIDVVAGSYKLTAFRYVSGPDVINLPKMPHTQNGQTISGTVSLNPANDKDRMTLTLILKATGKKDSSLDIDNVEVKKTSEAYGLYVNDQLVADADGDNIIFSLDETDPQTKQSLELKFTAQK